MFIKGLKESYINLRTGIESVDFAQRRRTRLSLSRFRVTSRARNSRVQTIASRVRVCANNIFSTKTEHKDKEKSGERENRGVNKRRIIQRGKGHSPVYPERNKETRRKPGVCP